MAVLALLCLGLGGGAIVLVPVLQTLVGFWEAPRSVGLANLVPFETWTWCALAIWIAVGAVAGLAVFRARKAATWDCGYAKPTGRMQYTASSLARSITLLFRGMLRPREHFVRPRGAFPQGSSLESRVDDPILERILAPVSRRLDRWGAWFRKFQPGLAQLYIAYILVALLALLLTLVPFQALWSSWLVR
jgi:hypothetical protein